MIKKQGRADKNSKSGSIDGKNMSPKNELLAPSISAME